MAKLAPATTFAIDQIVQVRSYRDDLGDIDALAASIKEHGLISPLVITIDGVLVSGARRLAAVKQLGWRDVPVYVAAALTDDLRTRLAMTQDLVHTKALTLLEASALFDEVRDLLEEERELTRDRLAEDTGKRLGTKESGDSPGSYGDLRSLAARAITDTDSSQRLERVSKIRKTAEDERKPEPVRQAARDALAEVAETQSVNRPWHKLRRVEALEHLRRLLASPGVDEETAANARRLQLALGMEDDPAQAADLATCALALTPEPDTGGRAAKANRQRKVRQLRFFLHSVTKQCAVQSVTGLGPDLSEQDATQAREAATGLTRLADDIGQELVNHATDQPGG